LSILKDRSFVESRTTSAEAKKALLEKFRAKMTQEDPKAEERRSVLHRQRTEGGIARVPQVADGRHAPMCGFAPASPEIPALLHG